MPLIPCFNCNPTGRGVPDPECPYCQGNGSMQTDADTATHVSESVQRHPSVTLNIPPRYPLEFKFDAEGRVVVLSNDGRLWRLGGVSGWVELPPLPQPAEAP